MKFDQPGPMIFCLSTWSSSSHTFITRLFKFGQIVRTLSIKSFKRSWGIEMSKQISSILRFVGKSLGDHEMKEFQFTASIKTFLLSF
jgi:hypothetical protein